MMRPLKLGDFELIWLNGGSFELDGGAMFGVVPKILWSKKYPPNDENFVPLITAPILIKTPTTLSIIESGLGNKLTEKQKKIFRVKDEWKILADLKSLHIEREDIDYVILTHLDFDHCGGIVMLEKDNSLSITFPKAKHFIQKREWEDAHNPNARSSHSLWPINFELLKDSPLLNLVEGTMTITDGIKVIHTGGHNSGHQIIEIESKGQKALHLADVLPTHAHFNPLWVMAYDNYPLEVIALREKYEKKGIEENAWFTFYHDPYVYACKFDKDGNITEKWVR
ncbi:MAG: MBL fold metallo-hydrolase [Thermodesulfovibrionales bacterium]|nr:MBL fold metallo-hydrolase [Thermodesulfovibrionales bacterium]